MDFVHDQLSSGRKFRVLTVIDQWSRESVLLEVDFSLTGQSVVDALEILSLHHPLPKAITVDHGTEFTSKALDEWSYRRGVQRPGSRATRTERRSRGGRDVAWNPLLGAIGSTIRIPGFLVPLDVMLRSPSGAQD
jgi:transposase InsO family protein